MKTRLLFTFLFITIYSTAQVSDFVTGLSNEPSRLIIDNDIIYVKGVSSPGEIIEIDLASANPTSNVLFTTSASFEIGGLIKEGNTIYISNVNSSTGESALISFDINTPTIVTNIASGLGFVSSIDIYNNELYFTDESLSGGGSSLKKVDITISNPSVNTILTGLTNPQDMEFNGNTLYIGDRDAGGGIGIIYEVDVTLATPTLSSFITNVNVRGVYVFNDFLYFSDAGVIKKAPFSNSSNVTTEAMDTGNSSEFLRDVVISGNTLYMPQETAGKIVTTDDFTLSVNEFNDEFKNLSIYNDENKVYVKGLNKNQTVRLFSLTGQQLFTKKITPNENSIDISNFAKGIYLLNIENKKSFKFAR